MMRKQKDARRPSRFGGWPRALIVAALAVSASACDSLLDVANPNNVKEEDLSNPTAATAMANGVLNRVALTWSSLVLDHGAVSDELRWVGSRDAYRQLDLGNISDPNNEFSDATLALRVGEARWWADEVIERLEQFRSDGTLASVQDLARAYLYAAFIYVAIADHYDDFVLAPDARTCSQAGVPECAPVGPANMSRLYDTAISYVDNALALGPADALELQLLAMRARANFQKGVWEKVNPSGTVAADPLVNSAAAAADAQAFLAASSDIEWRYAFTYTAATAPGGSDIGAWVNNRLEFRQGDPYITPTANDKDIASVEMTDLIDTETVSPILSRLAMDFEAGGLYPPGVALSAREMRLILAEVELARGNTAGFATHINAIRTADELTPYDPANAAHPDAIDMLVHMRQTNLYLQARRLMDHYRFELPSVDWQLSPPSDAVRTPGSFFPITRIERESNPNVG